MQISFMMTFAFAAATFVNIILITLLAFWLRNKFRSVYGRITDLQATTFQSVMDATAVRAAAPSGAPLPSPGGWTLSGDALLFLLREIETRRPALIVELGGGLSTLLIATKLRELGTGRLVSVDHDRSYAARTRSWLTINDLDELVDLRTAPLAPGPEGPPWYDVNVLDDLYGVDLLVVDGPPMPIHSKVRAPALPYFWKRLSEDWRVFVDDADRTGEREFLDEWVRRFPRVKVDHLPFSKGGVLIRPDSVQGEAWR